MASKYSAKVRERLRQATHKELQDWLYRGLEAIRCQAKSKKQGPFQKSMAILLQDIEGPKKKCEKYGKEID